MFSPAVRERGELGLEEVHDVREVCTGRWGRRDDDDTQAVAVQAAHRPISFFRANGGGERGEGEKWREKQEGMESMGEKEKEKGKKEKGKKETTKSTTEVSSFESI